MFVQRHRVDLMRTAVLLCAGDEGFAEDVVQTTLTKLYLSWSRVRRSRDCQAYARTTLTNVFIDECRRAHRRRETLLADPSMSDIRRANARDDHELRLLVAAALNQLGPRQRAVVVLRHWLDLDVAETARVLDCSVGNVKSQDARALARLRAVLAPFRDLVAPEGMR